MERHRGWFTLLIRAIGLWLTVDASRSVIGTLFWVADLLSPKAAGARPVDATQVIWTVWGLVTFALGVYLLLGGRRLVDWCLRSVDGICPRCGYDIRNVRDGVCPECGLVQPAPSKQKPE